MQPEMSFFCCDEDYLQVSICTRGILRRLHQAIPGPKALDPTCVLVMIRRRRHENPAPEKLVKRQPPRLCCCGFGLDPPVHRSAVLCWRICALAGGLAAIPWPAAQR